MAKKKNEDAQQKAVAQSGSENQNEQAVVEQQSEDQKSQRVSVATTEGNTIDRIRIFQKDGATMVQADYGKLNPEGKTSEERRAGMRTQLSRPLTAEQTQEYQRQYAIDPAKAKEYAVREVYPMHVNDAAFHLKDTTINDRKVNYITLEKITEDTLLLNALRKQGVDVDHMNREQRADAVAKFTPEEKDTALKDSKGLVGKWQLAVGEKGNKESRFYGILNSQELANIRHRAEVTLDREEVKDKNGDTVRDKRGNAVTREVVKSVGAPLTMAAIAGQVEQRVLAQRQDNEAKLEAAKKVDWSKFKLPSAATLTSLRYSASKEHPDRAWLTGNVNGIQVSGLLSKNETTAVKNKVATLEQVAAANRDFSGKVLDIVGPGQKETVTQDDAVKAIVERASDPAAKAFTEEQSGIITKYLGDIDGDGREDVVNELWDKANSLLAKSGVNEQWKEDAHQELKDLSEGIVRPEQQGLHR